ncbi:phosphatidylinositol-4-phosphate 5-kinase-domain-containing protein [Biscogniauxia mediterranea]|nr:phosphatidylinositol-4-phosphate 5-kinase-domain-containing protein [Biscogniauxia mediterranea]
MARRETRIARCIIYAILLTREDGRPRHRPSLFERFLRLFHIFKLTLGLVQPDLFKALRGVWGIIEEDYRNSFGGAVLGTGQRRRDRRKLKTKDFLQSLGGMGYSGSTFFRTRDSAYLVKSVPRHSENDFFKNTMLIPYADHMRANPSSLLVHITDFLESRHKSIGMLFGLAPSHHIVMENILHGRGQGTEGGTELKWESWDLKPTSYFYPERDVAGGMLAPASTKSKLADEFNDKIRLTEAQAAEFMQLLEKDSQLLADCNAVDYSLFLVRISAAHAPDGGEALQSGEVRNPHISPARPPFAPPNPPSWRTGVTSSDGKEIYRVAVLDFFWAKHTVRAKAMTGLIRGYNLIDEQGPMSITTGSKEYRKRFLRMCKDLVGVQG